MEDAEKRVLRLEHRVKTWMIVSIVLFVLLAGFIAVEKFTPLIIPREVAARKIVLKDKGGTSRARFYVDDSGTVFLKFADKQGITRAMIGATGYGTSSLRMMDHKGNTRVILGVLTNALPGLYLKDVNRRTRIGLVVLPNTSPVIFLKDEDKENIWRVP